MSNSELYAAEKAIEEARQGTRGNGSGQAPIENSDAPPGVLLSEVKPEKVTWLWRNRIPLKKITMLDGDPDLGKSLVTLDIIARLSTGRPLPGETEAMSGGAIILTAEDGLADTVVPRLIAAGANLERIVALKYTPDHEGEKTVSNIPMDLPVVMAAIERVGAKLVIVDVLMAYLPVQTNTHRDQHIRLALAPLAQMAERMGVAVICIRHLAKAGGANAMYSGGGSIGIIGAARAGLLVARDPEDPTLMVLARVKGNLGPPMPSLCYRILANNEVPYLAWQGESAQTAYSLLAATVGDDEERGALTEAKDFLRQALEDGRRPQKDVKAEARKAGIADGTLRRAKVALGVKSGKNGFVSEWSWELLQSTKPAAEGAKAPEHEHLRKNSGNPLGFSIEESITYPKVIKIHEDAQGEQGEQDRTVGEKPDLKDPDFLEF